MPDVDDQVFDAWRTRVLEGDEPADLLGLYDEVARREGVAPESLDLSRRRALARRAMPLIWPDFEQVATPTGTVAIEVVEHDPLWHERFEHLAHEIERVLADTALRIEHIGSSAVEGLAAKPIVDAMVSVAVLEDEQRYVPQLASIGLELYSRDSEHRFFSPAPPAPRDTHVHVCAAGSRFERDHLLFRDYLRANAEARQHYESIKREAAARWSGDRAGYTYAKSAPIRSMMQHAEQWAKEVGWTPS